MPEVAGGEKAVIEGQEVPILDEPTDHDVFPRHISGSASDVADRSVVDVCSKLGEIELNGGICMEDRIVVLPDAPHAPADRTGNGSGIEIRPVVIAFGAPPVTAEFHYVVMFGRD